MCEYLSGTVLIKEKKEECVCMFMFVRTFARGCECEFADEFKYFRIFEKLMNSEVLGEN